LVDVLPVAVYSALISEPVMSLYRHAPTIGGFGGWNGFSLPQICARLSGQTESFWNTHAEDCEMLVDARLSSFLITGQTLVYFYLMFRTAQWVLSSGIRSVYSGIRAICTKNPTPSALQIQNGAPHTIVYYGGQPENNWS
jgi:hypothetical protein